MPKELEQRIAARSDEDLYEMLFVHREDWTLEALAIAEQEWSRRELTVNKLAAVQATGDERKRQRAAIKDEPLSMGPKILFFVFNFAFCLGIVQLLIADSLYKSNGYERKYRDCFKWMAYGFLCLFVVSLMIHLLSQ
jgi:hypothetical protein